jgi:hypothetical protein
MQGIIWLLRSMKYRDVLTVLFALGFVLSLAYAWGVSTSVWFWAVPIAFGIALIWAIYFLWLT